MKKILIVLGTLAALSGVSIAAAVGMGWLEFKNAEYATNPCRAGHECVYPSSVDHKPHAVDSLGNELGAWGSGGITSMTWTAPTLSGAWTNFGSIYDTAAYGKDSLGFVNMRGLIAGGAGTVFVLPVGYRPLHSVFILTTGSGGSTASTAIIEVDADGTVAMTGTNTAVSLWPVRFVAEQ